MKKHLGANKTINFASNYNTYLSWYYFQKIIYRKHEEEEE